MTQQQGSESPLRDESAQAYDSVLTSIVDALVAHDYAQALALSETAVSTSPWLDYDRAEALAGLGRVDEATQAFTRAQERFREGIDAGGEAAAMWGRAHMLAEAGRCAEARQAYKQYATSVRPANPNAAEMAGAYANACRPLVLLH